MQACVADVPELTCNPLIAVCVTREEWGGMRHPAACAVCLTPRSRTVSLVETAQPLIPHWRLIMLSHRLKEPGGTLTPSHMVTFVPTFLGV